MNGSKPVGHRRLLQLIPNTQNLICPPNLSEMDLHEEAGSD